MAVYQNSEEITDRLHRLVYYQVMVVCLKSRVRVSRILHSAWSLRQPGQWFRSCSPLHTTDYDWVLWSMSGILLHSIYYEGAEQLRISVKFIFLSVDFVAVAFC